MFETLVILLLATPGISRLSQDVPDTLPHMVAFLQDSTLPVVLRFGGDFLVAGNYARAVGDSIDCAFRGFEVLKKADVAEVNLEGPITMRGIKVKKPYNFRMHPRFLSALASAGINVVNLANNHIHDFGDVGLYDTFSYLDSIGIHHCGAGRNREEAHTPVVLTVRGRTIALFGYYSGEEAPRATRAHPGVAERSLESIRHDIDSVRGRDRAAYVVVNLHWGKELAQKPGTGQIDFAHRVIDAGADLIIGHHPHVLQGVERYRSGVIAYSLGSFVFGGKSRGTYNSAVFEVQLKGGNLGYRLIPIRIERWRALELHGEQADTVSAYVRKLSRIFPESIFDK